MILQKIWFVISQSENHPTSYSIKSPLSSSKTAVFYYLEQPVLQIEPLPNS